ncbi:MAG: alanine racemase [Actinomycetota bacterium]|nr:alanine racemase [Actinomycetota bacterium]
MSIVLHVDGDRWRDHLRRTTASTPGIVPVVKGNGYGLGLPRLLAESAHLVGEGQVRQVAVGTYAEIPLALSAHPGDVLVMEPYRAAVPPLPGVPEVDFADPRLIHTVTRATDAEHLTQRAGRVRVVVEGLTSMNRFGVPLEQVARLRADLAALPLDVEAMTLHLPLGHGHLDEVSHWVEAVDVPTWYVSHLGPSELATLRSRHPGREFRPRVGTALWLGDPGALTVRAHVLDVRPAAKGDHAGYRQRPLRPGSLLVVSGGTAHGIALEAPSAASTLRQRAIVVAEGVLQAAHRVRSPFSVDGRPTWFAEPPHMQVSLLSLPAGVRPPAIGDELSVRVRHTTLLADAVVVS